MATDRPNRFGSRPNRPGCRHHRPGFSRPGAVSGAPAFTLVELLVSVAVVSVIALIFALLVGRTSSIWLWTSARTEQFREAREAFEGLTSQLSQATLNTYWDYNSATLPTAYERRSELRFVSGPANLYLGNGPKGNRVTHCVFFHAPLGVSETAPGLENLLNVCGYYVELNNDASFRPPFLVANPSIAPPKYRFRLMEFRQSSEQLSTYRYTSGLDPANNLKAAAIGYRGQDWYRPAANSADAPSRVLAENVIALIITPRLSPQDEQALPAALKSSSPDYSPLAPVYAYDSALTANPGQPVKSPLTNPKSQLPPILQVTMVVIDEPSASRLNLTAASTDVFGVSNKFSATEKYSDDLLARSGASNLSLENTLVARKVGYRIFSTSIPVRAAKWSRDEVE